MDDYNLPPQGPPAYALESSSSEDEWDEELQDIDPRRHQATRRQAKPEPVVQVHGSVATGTNVVFLVGEAGERVAKGVAMTNDASAGAAATVTVDGVQLASILPQPSQTTLVFLSQELPLVALHPLASAMFTALAPSATTTIASYHLPSYVVDTVPTTPPVLFLRSQPTPQLMKLQNDGDLAPFRPPNLLHGLPSMLLTLSTLASFPSLLVLLPTLAQPQPLNGPFTTTSSNLFYDAGPTGLSNPNDVYNEIRPRLGRIANALGWSWWRAAESNGQGFAWLEQQRKHRRKEEMRSSSMYM